MDNEDIKTLFGKRLRQLRIQRGYSQEEFAGKCGLDRTYISSLERGKRNISLKNIESITIALDISFTKFFSELDGHDGN